MTLSLPPLDSPIRDLFEAADLADMLSPQNRCRVPSFSTAVRSGRRFVREEKAARAVHSVCVRADGSVVLLRVGPRGGHKALWKFGKLGH